MDIVEGILKVAGKKKPFKTADVLDLLDHKFSRQAVSGAIGELVKREKLVRRGRGPGACYVLAENVNALANSIRLSLNNEFLAEHEVLIKIREDRNFWKGISENVDSIFAYAFSEMLNNAIDHSQSKKITVEVLRSEKNLSFTVLDGGVGVFRNIMQKRALKSEMEAIQDLLKGKTTTAPKAHSGEGIFFTSKVADEFVLKSFGLQLRIDNKVDDLFVEEVKPIMKGTLVTFVIALNSKKHLSDVFRKFEAEPGNYAFDKTEIQVRLYETGTIYISRSQAKRLLVGLEKFKKIILDFDRVPTVGQAFADEVFRVFKIQHPEIEVVPVNMVEPVAFMVGRVEGGLRG